MFLFVAEKMKVPTGKSTALSFMFQPLTEFSSCRGSVTLKIFDCHYKHFFLASMNGSSGLLIWNRRFRHCVVPDSVLMKCEGRDRGDRVLLFIKTLV